MSFRGRGESNTNSSKMDIEPRKFGGPDSDKSNREDSDRFDSSRRGRPPFGRGGRQSPGRDKFNDRRDYGGYSRDEQLMRDRSPMHGPDDRFSDRFRKEDSFSKRDDHGRKDSGRPYYGDDSPRDRFMDSRSRHEGSSGSYGNSRFDGPPSSMPFKPRGMSYPSSSGKGFFNEGFPRPNECEIIVVNKQQRAYAESVEDRVKNLEILVDILFLKDEALLTQTIDDIARRGSLYAMVISPQNETHRSVTVNILHGTPQEHRNMPLEDALKLLARNFHEHIRSQRERMERERAERGQYVGVVADREMQFLLRMIADGRWISLSEINLVIRYLSERRDKMSAGDDRGPSRMPLSALDAKVDSQPFKPKDNGDTAQKEQDLQNRIINLMSQGVPPALGGTGSTIGADTGLHSNVDTSYLSGQNQPSLASTMSSLHSPGMKSGRPGLDDQPGPQGLKPSVSNKDPISKPSFPSVPSSTLPSDPASTATYINFDNPSVQKALDNLMQSGPNLLKNISLSTSGVTSTPSNQPSTTAGDNSMMPPPNMMQQRGVMNPRESDISGSTAAKNPGSLDMGARGGPDMGPRGGPDMGARGGPDMGARGGPDMGARGGPDMGPRGGPDMGPRGGPDMGPRGGPDMGVRGGADMGVRGGPDMGPRGGPDMGPRGPNMGPRGPDMGSRGPDMGARGPDMGARGPDMGARGPDMGARGLDMGPRGSDLNQRGPDMGPRGPDMGGPGGPRGGNMPGMGGMGSGGRGGYGSMPDMGHMNNPRGFGSGVGGGMPDMGRMGPPPPRGGMGLSQGQDMGPPPGMGPGSNFPSQNQFNKYQGPGQQGNFPGPYSSGPGMGNMGRQNYGGPPGMGGMGGGPRRY